MTPTTYYANTRYGYVRRQSKAPYKNWAMVVTKGGDGFFLAEVSFHKRGNLKKRPMDAAFYDAGEVSLEPCPGLVELKKRTEPPRYGWIVLPAL